MAVYNTVSLFGVITRLPLLNDFDDLVDERKSHDSFCSGKRVSSVLKAHNPIDFFRQNCKIQKNFLFLKKK